MSKNTPKSPTDIARECLIRYKMYKVITFVMLLFGVLMMFAFYTQILGGQTSTLLDRPYLIIFLFIPFLPAVVFSLLAEKNNRKMNKTLFAESQAGDKISGK